MIDLAIIVIYLLIVLYIGLSASKKVNTSEDYATGGRQYKSFAILATLTASFVGGGFTIGLAEKTFMYGIVFILAIWGFSFKEYLIARFIAPRMDYFRGKADTTGEIMEIGFGQTAKIITGIASILVCGGIIGAQFLACGNILNIFLGFDPHVGSLIVAAIILIYSSMGGLKSVVAADILHFCTLIIMLPLVMYFGIEYAGGIDKVLSSLPKQHMEPLGKIGLLPFILVFLSFFFGETLIPPYVQRLLIGKSSYETSKGTLYSSFISILFFGVIGFIGLIAYSLDSQLLAYTALPYVIKMAVPIGFKGLAIAAMLAVVMSSADSFLNATSISMRKDVLSPLGIKIGNTAKSDLLASRVTTFVIGLVAVFFSLISTSALDILLYSYQFWTPFILVPLTAVILGVRANSSVFVFSAILGMGTLVVWNKLTPYSTGIDGALEGVLAGILVNSIAFILFLQVYRSGLKLENK